MASVYIVPDKALDLGTTDDAWSFYCGNFDILRIQPVGETGSLWNTAVISVETSCDGVNWDDLANVGDGPTSLTKTDENDILGPYFLQAIHLLRFRVSTTDASGESVFVHCVGGTTSPEALVIKVSS